MRFLGSRFGSATRENRRADIVEVGLVGVGEPSEIVRNGSLVLSRCLLGHDVSQLGFAL